MVDDRTPMDHYRCGTPSGVIWTPRSVGAPSWTIRAGIEGVPYGIQPRIPPETHPPVEGGPVRTVWIYVCPPPGVVPGISPGTETDGEAIDRAVKFVETCLIAFPVGIFSDKIEVSVIILSKKFLFLFGFLFRDHCADHFGSRISGGTVVDVIAISC